MNSTTPATPSAPDSRAALIAQGLASFRSTVAAMEDALAVSILYGQGFAVIMHEPYPHNPEQFCIRALSRVDPVTRAYRVDAPRCFPALDLLPDHFAGLCLFTREDAETIIAAQKDKAGEYPKGTTFDAVHIRTIQAQRLERAREMVTTLETCAATLAAECAPSV